MRRLEQKKLHEVFLSALEDMVLAHSPLEDKPLLVDLKPPLPHKIRLYIFNLTHPPGGRPISEHKIQIIVPGQKRGERANFDDSDSRIVILSGFEPELEVFALWDAGLYLDFSYSRNVQVKSETVYSALAGNIGKQHRRVRLHGTETVLTTPAKLLGTALVLRVDLTRERLIGA